MLACCLMEIYAYDNIAQAIFIDAGNHMACNTLSWHSCLEATEGKTGKQELSGVALLLQRVLTHARQMIVGCTTMSCILQMSTGVQDITRGGANFPCGFKAP